MITHLTPEALLAAAARADEWPGGAAWFAPALAERAGIAPEAVGALPAPFWDQSGTIPEWALPCG